MLARWLFGIAVLGTVAAACAEPPAAKKSTAAVCDPKISECGKSTGPRAPEDDGTLRTTKTGTALEAPDDATKAKAADELKRQQQHADGAGTDDAPPAAQTSSSSGTVPLADTPSTSSSSSSGSSSDDPLANVGPQCTKLWACCANLRAAGITGSADQCDDSALGNDELTCQIADENYKTPDDYYDPVCF